MSATWGGDLCGAASVLFSLPLVGVAKKCPADTVEDQ